MNSNFWEYSKGRKTSLNAICIVGIISLLSMIVVIPASADCNVYFKPDPASIQEGEGHNVTVQVLMDSAPGDTVGSWGTWIKFDHTCVNITGYTYLSDMNVNIFWVHEGDRVKLWNNKYGCSLHSNGTALVNLTVQCVNSSYCESPLEFIDNGVPLDKQVVCMFLQRNVIWHNGTVLQGGSTTQKPDLIPTDLNVKHNYYDGAWANLNNTVNVTVENNGTVDTGSFNVKLYAKLYADYEVVGTGLISNLSAGNSAVVSFLWTPNESEVYDLKAVVDPEDTITESNETNNVITKTQYVGYNGYMGDKPFTTYAHERHKGELKFTWGNSYYSSKIWPKDSGKSPYNYTVNFNIAVPDNATIKLARLYSYWTWSCKGSSGATPKMSVTFAGNELTPDKKYDDIKGWGGYSYPTGTYCYNVSSYISESGAYTAYLENTATDNSLSFCMDGFGLLVVYEDVNGHEIEYWINEGCDMLCTQHESGGLTSEEATATSAFSGTLDISKVKNSTLWTVVQSGGNINNILIFNTGNWSGAYDATPYSDLDIDERDVTGCLNSSDNIARIRAAVYPDGDYLVPSNAFLVVEYKDEEEKPDLIPTDLNVKHNYYDGAWANLNNTVNVTVENNGTVDTGSFNVKLYAKLYADYEVVGTGLISNLSAGNSAVVSFLWTPNESEVYDLKAVVDPEDTITESNETNNVITKTQYVGYNGYMGDKPFTTYAHERHKGELKFTWGNSYYSSKIWPKDSGKSPYNYTVNFNIAVPDNATIKLARLYSYWTWSCKGSSGATPKMSVTFAGNELTPDKKYDDIKGWGGYSYPTGTYCYNVSSYISESGAYTAYLENTATDNSLSFCMDGFGLLVVYEDVNGHEIEYWINEGCDMLCTQHESGGLTSEEATATSAFSGTLDISKVKNSTLWTVVQSGGNINNILIFNTGNWSGAYDATPYSDLDIDERDVTGCLNSSDNIARIRAAVYPDGDYLVPSNAFLVVEYKDEEEKPDLIPTDLNVKHNYYDGAWANLNNTVNVTVENNGTVDTGSFNVKLYAKLYADYEVVGTGLISNLSAGNSAVVSFLWTPNESEVYDLKAVVDPEDTITESNETNNVITKTQYVGYNGYMGDKPFTTYAHERHKGELKFTWGNSYYSSKIWPKDSGKSPYNYTVNFNIAVPDNATIKLARLYSYWTWSCKGSSGATPKMSVTFAGNELTPDKKYDDIKGWGGYSYPTGTYCYNVSSYISESGAYTAYLENTATDNSLSFCMDGFGLLVVYEDVNGHEIEYWINEGCDMLCTQHESGGLTSEEATATSAFSGTLDISKVKNSTLWTVVQSGGNINNILIFNTGNWSGAYDATPYSDLDIDERDVTGCLNSSDNIARIRAAVYPDGDYLVPSNAFLVVEYKDEERPEFDTGPGTYPSISGTHKGTITPRHDIAVRTMYTYPSAGTGGHTEFVELNNETFRISATWDGYQSDYHNITFPHQFTLLANHTYNYTIRTGSYPQIHHTNRLEIDNGTIRCHEFIDANDRKYNDSIPAILLSL